MNKTGTLYIVSAPSGAGKTSLLKALMTKTNGIKTSISTTTRPIRPGEVDAVDYHFVSIPEFNTMKDNDEFVEYAEVFGNFYGTSKVRLTESLNSGINLILEIDWQGAQQIRKQLPESISIFILPPSREELEARLKGRGQDDESIIQGRMASAIAEISHYNEYEFIIVNDKFDTALSDLEDIVNTRGLNLSKQSRNYQQLITDLL